jgi:tetratricopeptide (TPR) repeat protein
MALFNAGNVALEMKDTDRALKYYQRALELKPESKEVKTNIELALRDKKGGGGSQNNKGESNKNDPSKQDQDKQDQNQDDKSKKDQKGQGPEPRPSPRPQPKPFKSQEISEQDVKRLLEELKKREEKIRAQQNLYNKKNQDRNIEKDW